ncbi:MAG: hypothetical protein LVR00_01180 [Rhabdochlamydiaceae bacterium]|jgi:hypothetical protein
MNIHINKAPPLFSIGSESLGTKCLEVAPKLEVPTRCLGPSIVELARQIDANNTGYVRVAVGVCQSFMDQLNKLSADHAEKLRTRASFLSSNRLWTSVVRFCSSIGSALSLFAGFSSGNPTASIIGIGLGLFPFIYKALSIGVEQKDLEKIATQFGCLLAMALFFSYFQVDVPTFNPEAIFSLGLSTLGAISSGAKGIYDARLTWKDGELKALKFFMEEIQQKLQEMTGSMADNIKSVATNTSFLNDVMSQYISTKTNFIRG